MLLRTRCMLLASVVALAGSVACGASEPPSYNTAKAQSGLVFRAPASKKTQLRTGITHWHTIIEKNVVVIDGSDAKGNVKFSTAFRKSVDGKSYVVEDYGKKKGALIFDGKSGIVTSNSLPQDSWPLYAASFAIDFHAYQQNVPYGVWSNIGSAAVIIGGVAAAVAIIATAPVWVPAAAGAAGLTLTGVVALEALAAVGIVAGSTATGIGAAAGATALAATIVRGVVEGPAQAEKAAETQAAIDKAVADATAAGNERLAALEAKVDAAAKEAADAKAAEAAKAAETAEKAAADAKAEADKAAAEAEKATAAEKAAADEAAKTAADKAAEAEKAAADAKTESDAAAAKVEAEAAAAKADPPGEQPNPNGEQTPAPPGPDQGQPMPPEASASNLDTGPSNVGGDTGGSSSGGAPGGSSSSSSGDQGGSSSGGDVGGGEFAAAVCRKTACSKTRKVCICTRY